LKKSSYKKWLSFIDLILFTFDFIVI
jgi:hypothetical protein